MSCVLTIGVVRWWLAAVVNVVVGRNVALIAVAKRSKMGWYYMSPRQKGGDVLYLLSIARE